MADGGEASSTKKPKLDRWAKRGRNNREMDFVKSSGARFHHLKGGKVGEREGRRGGREDRGDRGETEKTVIAFQDWERTNSEKWRRFPTTTCCHGGTPQVGMWFFFRL